MIALLLALCAFSGGSVAFGPPVGSAVPDTHDPFDGSRLTVVVSHDGVSVGARGLDRFFSTFDTVYRNDGNLSAFHLHQSCCGSTLEATATSDADALEVSTTVEHGQGLGTTVERYAYDRNAPLIATRDEVIVPYLFAARKAKRVRLLDVGLTATGQPVTEARLAVATATLPFNVPKGAKVVAMTTAQATTLFWYDPCTYHVYAYGSSAPNASVDRSLAPPESSRRGIP